MATLLLHIQLACAVEIDKLDVITHMAYLTVPPELLAMAVPNDVNKARSTLQRTRSFYLFCDWATLPLRMVQKL